MCFLICIRLLSTACNASLYNYIYSWTQLVRPLVFGSYHSRVEKPESVPSISTLVGSAEPADPHGGGPGQPEGGRPKLLQFRENCQRHGREKHLELKVLLKRKQQKMLRSVRRRARVQNYRFLKRGFENVQDLAHAKWESLQPQEDADLGSHHATASSSSAPSQCLRPIFNTPLRFQDSPYRLQTFLLLALHLKSLNWEIWSFFLLFFEPRQKKDAVPCFFPGRPWAWWTGASPCRMASLCTMPFSPGVWWELQHKESKHIRCCGSCVYPRHGRLRRSPRLHSRQKGPGHGLARRLARTPRVLPESANAALAGDLLHQVRKGNGLGL